MTDTIVRILIDDPVCCANFCHMLMDLVNGFLSKDVMRRLTRSRLIAIPKTNGGVRPVAVGEVIMKLAGSVLVQRFEFTLQPLFSPIQQGVMAKSGCERVIHTLNFLYKEGSCIMSIDVKNAFNAPSRNDLARAVYGLATLRPFTWCKHVRKHMILKRTMPRIATLNKRAAHITQNRIRHKSLRATHFQMFSSPNRSIQSWKS